MKDGGSAITVPASRSPLPAPRSPFDLIPQTIYVFQHWPLVQWQDSGFWIRQWRFDSSGANCGSEYQWVGENRSKERTVSTLSLAAERAPLALS